MRQKCMPVKCISILAHTSFNKRVHVKIPSFSYMNSKWENTKDLKKIKERSEKSQILVSELMESFVFGKIAIYTEG